MNEIKTCRIRGSRQWKGITSYEASKLTGLHVSILRYAIQRGDIRCVQLYRYGRTSEFTLESLRAYIVSNLRFQDRYFVCLRCKTSVRADIYCGRCLPPGDALRPKTINEYTIVISESASREIRDTLRNIRRSHGMKAKSISLKNSYGPAWIDDFERRNHDLRLASLSEYLDKTGLMGHLIFEIKGFPEQKIWLGGSHFLQNTKTALRQIRKHLDLSLRDVDKLAGAAKGWTFSMERSIGKLSMNRIWRYIQAVDCAARLEIRRVL